MEKYDIIKASDLYSKKEINSILGSLPPSPFREISRIPISTLQDYNDWPQCFKACGDYLMIGCSNGQMFISSDGVSWQYLTNVIQQGEAAGSTDVEDVAYNGHAYVAVSYGPNMSRSLDGYNWTPISQNILGEDPVPARIAAGGLMFLVLRRSSIIYSTDSGITWKNGGYLPDTSTITQHLTYGGSWFVCGGYDDNYERYIYCSMDCMQWYKCNGSSEAGVWTDEYIYGICYSSKLKQWQVQQGGFIMLGKMSSSDASPEDAVWEKDVVSDSEYFKNIISISNKIRNTGREVLFGNTPSKILYSFTGAKWLEIDIGHIEGHFLTDNRSSGGGMNAAIILGLAYMNEKLFLALYLQNSNEISIRVSDCSSLS